MAHITLHTPLHDAHVPQNPHLVQHGLGILSSHLQRNSRDCQGFLQRVGMMIYIGFQVSGLRLGFRSWGPN